MMDYDLKKSLEQGKYKSAIPVTKADRYTPGQWYWCGYWHQAYKVFESHYKTVQGRLHLQSVTVQWDDGRIGTHCTRLDHKRDYKLRI